MSKEKQTKQLVCIDSRFRNRNKFPSPYNFGIQVRTHQTEKYENKENIDLISREAPLIVWTPGSFNQMTGYIQMNMTRSSFLVRYETHIPRNMNYFKNMKVSYGNPTEKNYIESWIFSHTDSQGHEFFILQLRNDVKLTPLVQSTITFSPPFSYNLMYIPEHYLFTNVNHYIVNDSKTEHALITHYHEETNMALFDNNNTLWDETDSYSLRLGIPKKMFSVKNSLYFTNTNTSFAVSHTEIDESILTDFNTFTYIANLGSSENKNVTFKTSYVDVILLVSNSSDELNEGDIIKTHDLSFPKQFTILSKESKSFLYYYAHKTEHVVVSLTDLFSDFFESIPTKNISWEFMFKAPKRAIPNIIHPVTTGIQNSENSKGTSIFINESQNKIGINLFGEIAYYTFIPPNNTVTSNVDDVKQIPNMILEPPLVITPPITLTSPMFTFETRCVPVSNNPSHLSNLVLFCVGYKDENNTDSHKNITCFITKTSLSSTVTIQNNTNEFKFVDIPTNLFDNLYHDIHIIIDRDIKLYVDGIDQGNVTPAFTHMENQKNGVMIGKNISNPLTSTVDNQFTFRHFRIFDKALSEDDIKRRSHYGSDALTSYGEVDIQSDLFDDAYHHIVVTLDEKSKQFLFYVDNTMRGSLTLPDYYNANTTGFTIGHPFYYQGSNFSIKNVYLYDFILSQNEITHRFNERNNLSFTLPPVTQTYTARYNKGSFNKVDTYILYNDNDNPITVQFKDIMFHSYDLKQTPLSGDLFEILNIDIENEYIIMKQPSTKSIKSSTFRFISLSIPNCESKYTKHILQYPYLILNIYNTQSASQSSIVSNHPERKKIVFQIPTRNVEISGRFITMTNAFSLKQDIFFDSHRDFHIEICSPNGKILSTIIQDTTMPVIPSPQAQTYIELELIQT